MVLHSHSMLHHSLSLLVLTLCILDWSECTELASHPMGNRIVRSPSCFILVKQEILVLMGLYKTRKQTLEILTIHYACKVITRKLKPSANSSLFMIACPREARNPNLDSDQWIAYYVCAPRLWQGCWNQNLKFCCATKNDQNAKNVSIISGCHMGCRLFCHMEDQSTCTFADVITTVCHMGSTLLSTHLKLSRETILKTQPSSKRFFPLELELGT